MELPVSSKSLKKWERITIKPGITLRKSPFLKERFQADEAYVFKATLRERKSPEAFVLIRRHGKTTDPDQNFRDTLLKENQRNQKKNIQPSNF